jgi:hypothetical protein
LGYVWGEKVEKVWEGRILGVSAVLGCECVAGRYERVAGRYTIEVRMCSDLRGSQLRVRMRSEGRIEVIAPLRRSPLPLWRTSLFLTMG